MKHTLFRVARLGFLLGLVMVLLRVYLAQVQAQLPTQVEKVLVELQVLRDLPEPLPKNMVSTVEVLEIFQSRRKEKNLTPLTVDERLTKAAETIVNKVIEHGQDLETIPENITIDAVSSEEYPYALFDSRISYTVASPKSDQFESIINLLKEGFADDETMHDVGMAVKEHSNEQGVFYYSVLLIAKQVTPATKPVGLNPRKSTPKPFPVISNSDVLAALNSYRQSHKVHALTEHPALCKYAEKRVKDQIAFGALDKHEGFRKDFDNEYGFPEILRHEYPGEGIGENLAYQHCRNMTTGDPFVAETGTALIEWCFDSSTAGHREAQLSSRYNNACVRNEAGFFVIIFGE